MNNGHEPATKADLQAVRGDIESVREQIRDSETKLLTAFYEFAKANQRRLSEPENSDAAI